MKKLINHELIANREAEMLQTIINKCKALMPDETHNSYYILEDLVMAMQEMAWMSESSIRRGEMGMATWPLNRFMKLRNEFVQVFEETVKK